MFTLVFVCLNVGRISVRESFSMVSTEVYIWPGTKQSTQFKHFPECFFFFFFANTVHFVMFKYFVSHCDLEWFDSPVHLWLLSFFFFYFNHNRGQLFWIPACVVCVQIALFYFQPSCYCIYCICMAVSNQIKCFSRKYCKISQQIFI